MACRNVRTGPSAAVASVLLALLCGCGDDDLGGAGGDGGPPPSVTLLSPNGGETWVLGSTQTVHWSSSAITAVRIELSRDGGASWEDIAASVAAPAGSFSWAVDDGGMPSPQTLCLLRVSEASDGSPSDASDAEFTIRGARVLRVDAGAAPGGDGLSWATAFAHPQDAADAAFAWDEIWVAGGVYRQRGAPPPAGDADTVVLAMKEGVRVYGGFAGTEVARDERDWTANVTTLDGELAVDHVVSGASEAGLDGFVVTRASGVRGGGMYNYMVRDLSVANCVFSDSSGSYGGGMYNYLVRHLVVADCTFSGNSGYDGGGMYNSQSWLTVAGCVFSGNGASADGGGMHNSHSAPEVRACVFAGNSAYRGGGMANEYSSPAVRDCTFDGNSAAYSGAGMSSYYQSSPVVTGCVFVGNVSDGSGGGMYVRSGCAPVVTNCVFRANDAASDGGGFYVYDGSPAVTNCTFNWNSAGSNGGALYTYNYTGNTPSLTNCVLWGDTAETGPEILDSSGGVLVVSYCDVEGGFAGTGNLDADPLFADAAAGDLALTAGSPCIDAADGSAAMSSFAAADILHHPRVDDPATTDTGAGSPTYADIGAYEYVPAGESAVSVLAPDGGEHWALGSSRVVEWACANVAAVDIELSRDGGTSWETVASAVDAASRAYTWTVTDGGLALPQALCLVRITDAGASGASDTSDAGFAIGDGVWRVDVGAPAGGDGLTWASAFRHPQDAMDAASPGNEIWVASGLYLRRSPADTVLLAMKDGVAVYGGFTGSESARDERDPSANVTTLDGEGAAFHVVTAASNAVLDGFTVTGGAANGSDTADRQGAGLCAYGVADLAIAGCVFTGNQADWGGGGIYCSRSALAVVGCVFSGNATLHSDGGGLCSDLSLAEVARSGFDGNTADDDGGGVYSYGGPFAVTGSIFRGNSARDGGGICASAGHAITNCTFYANSAERGGGVCAYGTDTTGGVTNSLLWGNAALTGPQVCAVTAGGAYPVTWSCVQGGYEGVGNIDGDPKFADAPGGDLRLTAGSPCIDAADGGAAPLTDAAGSMRRDDPGLPNVGTGVPPYTDIGAYEFQGTTVGSWIEALTPEAGTSWRVGCEVLICWTATPDVADVKIELSRDGGASWWVLAASTPNDRSFAWTVTDGGLALPQPGCLLRVSNAAGGGPAGVSLSFTIFSGVWHVDAAAAVGGDGLTWATALRHPQDAMDAASSGDEMWVAAGTYLRRDSGDTTLLTMKGGVGVYGGFAGNEVSRDGRDWTANVAILDGELVAFHVVVGAMDAALDGFTVTRGYAYGGSSEDQVGGGMVARETSGLVVANCAFDSSSAMDYGGGLYVAGGSTLVSNCTFSGNSAREGGGICSPGGSPEVVDCAFTSNSAGSYGGGMRYTAYRSSSREALALVSRCVFDANSAGQYGGAMALSSSWSFFADPLRIEGCTFSTNTAPRGGGLYLSDGSPVVSNCAFWSNAASSYGGAAFLFSSDAEFVNCSMSGNSAAATGGGMYLESFCRAVVTNCILWGDTGPEIGSTFFGPDVSYSNVQGGSPGQGNIDADPLFVDAAAGELHLLPASPCIDAGDGAAAPPFDLDGLLRVDDPSVADTGVNSPTYTDMGAYEYAAPGAQGVLVTAPSGGEELPLGSALAITWQSVNVASVKVELSRDGGTIWETLAPSIAASAGSFAWTVTGPVSLDCAVRVSDASDGAPADVSAGIFAVGQVVEVTAPVGGEVWVLGSSEGITWRSSNIDNVRLEISRNGGADWETVVESTDADGSYVWKVTDGGAPLAQRGCLIRVSEADGGAVSDVSDAEFAIWDGLGLRVDPGAPAGGDGLDWAHAFRHPQDALDVASAGDEVWVTEGVYTRRVAGDTSVVAMASDVEIYGGFAGTETSRDERDFAARPTVLDGQAVCYHVVVGVSSSRLDGFTITGGNANGASTAEMRGAGFYIDGGDPVVANCILTGNVASESGGGAYHRNATFVDCTFDDNEAPRGGGMYCRAGWYSAVSGCTFVNNRASEYGGGLASCFGRLPVSRCTFRGNTAPLGAGMYNSDSDMTVSSCVFAGNAAVTAGGGVYNCDSCIPYFVNCSFSTNSAASGGAIYNDLVFIEVVNCILWGDSAATEPEICEAAGLPATVSYSCVEGGHAGEGNIAVDPMLVDAAAGDLRLSAGSPCIDAADGSAAPRADRDGGLRHDDAGVPNVGAGSPAFADIGAYELQGTTTGPLVSVVYPHGGAVLGVGDEVELRWVATSDIAGVKIELSRDDGGAWETLADPVANAGRYAWTVTDGALALPQTNCLVRVSDSASPGLNDTSGTFTIFAGVWHVSVTAPAGGDGRSWPTAFRHPQDALDAASPGQEVWVAQGTYYRRDAADLVLLSLKGGVEVYGGFFGDETARDQRDWTLYEAVLNGEDACEHVVFGASVATFDGFTVTEAALNGMYDREVSQLSVANCRFEAGTPPGAYYGMLNEASAVTVTDCSFTGYVRSAIMNTDGSDVEVTGSTFSANTCSFGTLYNYSSALAATGCSFLGNSADYGAGIRNIRATSQIVNCDFVNNSASSDGGAVCNSESSSLIEGCLFQGNSGGYGGGIANDESSPLVAGCSFLSNTAGTYGGGMYNDGGSSPTVVNCVFWDNTAGSGGAVYNDTTGFHTMTNCTFAANAASFEGGALHLGPWNYPAITNCILWGNTAPTGPEIAGDGVFGEYPDVTYTCIQGGYAGTGNIDLNPLFVDAATGNVRLSAGSPCIDAGDGNAAPPTDIDGNARVDDPSTEPNTGVGMPPYADMGAYEFQP